MENDNKVYIYLLNINHLSDADFEMVKSLFPQRYQKSCRFVHQEDQKRSIAAGCLLHEILNIRESDLSFSCYGKPYLQDGINFSLSHSGDYAVLAVGEKAMGVDIETINPQKTKVAERVFMDEELKWMAVDPHNRFWTLWTMKEATAKAYGMGMTVDFKSFTVMNIINDNSEPLVRKSWFFDHYAFSVITAAENKKQLKTEVIFLREEQRMMQEAL